GIGMQLAEGLAELGCDLVLCARKVERCEAVAGRLAAEHGVRALGLRCNLGDPNDVAALVRETVERLGRLDIVVNNAGTSWGAPALDYPLDGWNKVLAV